MLICKSRGSRSQKMKLQFHNAVRSRANRRQGIDAAFTLAEVMISVAVVGILFVSLYAGITSGFGVVNLARENLRATQVMQDRIEEMRLYTWDQVTSFGTSNSFIPATFNEPFYPNSTNLAASDLNATNNPGGFTYFGQISITNSGIDDSYSNDLRLVTVKVVWTNGTARRTRTLTTFVSQYGIQKYLY
jgi:prepilin-type N-terminal cleavage/methylation domain-containing protein